MKKIYNKKTNIANEGKSSRSILVIARVCSEPQETCDHFKEEATSVGLGLALLGTPVLNVRLEGRE
jgi:hypothetical protein